jgi:hypothetical protein
MNFEIILGRTKSSYEVINFLQDAWHEQALATVHIGNCGPVVNTPASYLGGPVFKSQFADRYPEVFMLFLSPSRQMLG